MGDSSTRGALALTGAQAWHALSGYFIFITAARLLGPEAFADFGLVIWTMTTLEVFVIDAVPRAVSWARARGGRSEWSLTRLGLRQTLLAGVALALPVILLAGLVADFWRDASLGDALRIAALDFIVFAGFAVFTQVANGARRFGAQTRSWLSYSTAKLVCVLGALAIEPTVMAGVCGYVLASLIGSLAAAFLAGRGLSREGEDTRAAELWQFGLPVSLQSLGLMIVVNADLWALRRSAEDETTMGAYTAAATLARALFFIFKAMGDALFPAVAAAWAAGDRTEGGRVARKGLAQLGILLFPLVGLAAGSSETTLRVIYGEGDFERGAGLLGPLCIAATGFTISAVLVQLIIAAGRPKLGAAILLLVLTVQTILLFGQPADGPGGAPALAAALMVVAGLFLIVAVGAFAWVIGPVLPLLPWLLAMLASAGLWQILLLWQPTGWLVFAYGAFLWVGWLGLAVVSGLWPRGKQSKDPEVRA